MSRAPASPTFRLLNARVGWEPRPDGGIAGLTGLDDPAGLRLAVAGKPADMAWHDLLPWFPDPRLAPGHGPCAWYLWAPRQGLLRRRDCAPGPGEAEWEPLWPGRLRGRVARRIVVAAYRHLLALAEGDRILLWRREGAQRVATIAGPAAALAFTPWNELLVARPGGTDLERYDLAGDFCGQAGACVRGPIDRVTVGRGCTIWAVSRDQGEVRLWRGERDGGPFRAATIDDLAAAVPRTTLSGVSELGFCLTEPGGEGLPERHCFGWDGERLTGDEMGAPVPPPREARGELLTTALDSGLPRCRWHRVRVDADTPSGTSVDVAVATGEQPDELPLADDWQAAPAGSRDVLVDQPAGRYLFVRLRLAGDGATSPVVRQVRLDFPRITSAELLPPVYRQDPAADDFTERFLSLFDASLTSVDRVVERYPALLDGAHVPDRLLPWLGSFLGLVFEPGWDAVVRRELIDKAPELYRRRGTVWALAETLRIVFRTEPVIEELARGRNWAALDGASRLPGVRLFGRSKARFRLDTSALGRAPLRSYGNPDDDPLTAQAHRIRVLVPPQPGRPAPDPAAVARLLAETAPAHVVVQIRRGGTGFVVGSAAVGVDSAFTSLPAPVLGGGPPGRGSPVRLNRASVLWPGRRGRGAGIRIGARSVVAVNTVAE